MKEAQESKANLSTLASLIYIILPEGTDGFKYVINKRKVTFGRNTSCEVRIQKTNVSDRHALLTVDDDGLIWLKNLNASTKTYLNGKEIHDNSFVGHNNVFTIGNNWFRLEYCPEIAETFSLANIRKRLLNPAALTDLTAQSQQSLASNNIPCLDKESHPKELSDAIENRIENLENIENQPIDQNPSDRTVETIAKDKPDENNSCFTPGTKKKRKSDIPSSARAPKMSKRTPRSSLRQSKVLSAAQDGAVPAESTPIVPDTPKAHEQKTPSYLSPVIGKTKKLFSVRSSARAAMKRTSLKVEASPSIRKKNLLNEEVLAESQDQLEEIIPSQLFDVEIAPIVHEEPVSKPDDKDAAQTGSPIALKSAAPRTPSKHNVRVLLSPNRLPTSVRKSLKRRLQHTPRRQLLQDFTSTNSTAASRLSELTQQSKGSNSGVCLTEIQEEGSPAEIQTTEIIRTEASCNGESLAITSAANKIENEDSVVNEAAIDVVVVIPDSATHSGSAVDLELNNANDHPFVDVHAPTDSTCKSTPVDQVEVSANQSESSVPEIEVQEETGTELNTFEVLQSESACNNEIVMIPDVANKLDNDDTVINGNVNDAVVAETDSNIESDPVLPAVASGTEDPQSVDNSNAADPVSLVKPMDCVEDSANESVTDSAVPDTDRTEMQCETHMELNTTEIIHNRHPCENDERTLTAMADKIEDGDILVNEDFNDIVVPAADLIIHSDAAVAAVPDNVEDQNCVDIEIASSSNYIVESADPIEPGVLTTTPDTCITAIKEHIHTDLGVSKTIHTESAFINEERNEIANEKNQNDITNDNSVGKENDNVVDVPDADLIDRSDALMDAEDQNHGDDATATDPRNEIDLNDAVSTEIPEEAHTENDAEGGVHTEYSCKLEQIEAPVHDDIAVEDTAVPVADPCSLPEVISNIEDTKCDFSCIGTAASSLPSEPPVDHITYPKLNPGGLKSTGFPCNNAERGPSQTVADKVDFQGLTINANLNAVAVQADGSIIDLSALQANAVDLNFVEDVDQKCAPDDIQLDTVAQVKSDDIQVDTVAQMKSDDVLVDEVKSDDIQVDTVAQVKSVETAAQVKSDDIQVESAVQVNVDDIQVETVAEVKSVGIEISESGPESNVPCDRNETDSRCQGQTKNGTRCKNKSKYGNYCRLHKI